MSFIQFEIFKCSFFPTELNEPSISHSFVLPSLNSGHLNFKCFSMTERKHIFQCHNYAKQLQLHLFKSFICSLMIVIAFDYHFIFHNVHISKDCIGLHQIAPLLSYNVSCQCLKCECLKIGMQPIKPPKNTHNLISNLESNDLFLVVYFDCFYSVKSP